MVAIHGDAHSRVDALCHVGFDGTVYNGLSQDSPLRPIAGTGSPVNPMAVFSSGNSPNKQAEKPSQDGIRKAPSPQHGEPRRQGYLRNTASPAVAQCCCRKL
jgi:hypothetical protein